MRKICRVWWLCLLGLAWAAAPAWASKRVALVIGNGAYADMPLRNPVNDANDLSAKLQQLGFEVTMLTDRNRSQMTQAIRQFGLTAQGAEAALFYFAGHGVQVRGRNYLLPVGQRFETEAEVETDAVDVNAVLARIEEAGAKVSLLILDACRNNPLVRSGRSAARGLARMEAPSGALIAFAAQPGAEALDGTGRNGTYTKHLLAHIGTPGLPLPQLFQRVRADVERETNRRQSPREETSLTADFFFANPFGRVTPEDERRMEDEAWELAKRLNTSASYQAYLAAYPQGRYVAAARVAIAGLQPVPVPTPGPAPVPTMAGIAPGESFRDCADCPEMVVVPRGQFLMGKDPADIFGRADQLPVRVVTIDYRFALSRTEVTFEQWDRCRAAGGCSHLPDDRPWGRGSRPVMNVSWDDANQYARWLSRRTGQSYRLPTEAEWEYACRAGQPGTFCGGNNLDHLAWTLQNSGGRTQPVGGKAANAYGLHDMSGNVREWTLDCYDENAYAGRAPIDGSAHDPGECFKRVVRGGSANSPPLSAIAGSRESLSPAVRSGNTGFRLARMLP